MKNVSCFCCSVSVAWRIILVRAKCVNSSCRDIQITENSRKFQLTSLKWTSCIPTSSIMEASSSMFGVITLKAVHPCLNIPRIKTARESLLLSWK